MNLSKDFGFKGIILFGTIILNCSLEYNWYGIVDVEERSFFLFLTSILLNLS